MQESRIVGESSRLSRLSRDFDDSNGLELQLLKFEDKSKELRLRMLLKKRLFGVFLQWWRNVLARKTGEQRVRALCLVLRGRERMLARYAMDMLSKDSIVEISYLKRREAELITKNQQLMMDW